MQDENSQSSGGCSEFDGDNQQENKSVTESDGGIGEVAENFTKKPIPNKNNL